MLSVVVAVRNEVRGIAWAVSTLRTCLDDLVASGVLDGAEIVVVDDHSTDATMSIVAELASRPGTPIRALVAAGPAGLGSALRRGFAAAQGDLILYTDADLPFDPGEIERLVATLDRYEADVLCGYRLDRTAEGRVRGIQSRAYNALVRGVLPVMVRDVNFACKLLRRPALDVVLPQLASDGPFIDAELMARLGRNGVRIIQVGVDYFPRFGSASTLGGPDAIATILREARRLYPDLRRR